MAIRPIDLPSAAALSYGQGDVRHFSEGDDQSVPGLSNPTRQLAERDNLVASKLNEVVSEVNNKEQVVSLPIPRTAIPADDEVVAINYRIAPGFEARVLNAAVAATPVSTDIELDVYYGTGFGDSTGTNIVSTSSEFTGGIQFYPAGEFIVTLKNKGAITLDVVSSVMLTVRPVGAVGTLLVGSVITGGPGPVGRMGPVGRIGPIGAGTTGAPGMVFIPGGWNIGSNYAKNDVVTVTTFGTVISSYIALQGNLGQNPLISPTFWSPVVTGGGEGAPGPAGGATAMTSSIINGTLITGADWQTGSTNGDYVGGGTPSSQVSVAMNEAKFVGATTNMALLNASVHRYFVGHGTLRFPQQAVNLGGAAANYTNTNIQVAIVDNGTNMDTAGTRSVSCEAISTTDYVLRVFDQYPVKVAITIWGAQSF